MSASPNAIKNPPATELVQSDEEDAVNVLALTQQLQEVELKNARIAKKKQEQVDVKRLKEEQDKVKRLKEEKDEVDKLTQEEAEQKTEKVNKKKRVSAI